MMNCRNCNFEVQHSMRHSLIKNCCPACGGALLGNLHSRRLDLLRQKLSNQPFSEKLVADDLFDIALFMLIEFFPPDVVAKAPSEEGEPGAEGAEPQATEATEAKEGPPAASTEAAATEESYEDIREQVRKEILKKNKDLLPEALDADLKIERLKRLAKESGVRSPGASVRRLKR